LRLIKSFLGTFASGGGGDASALRAELERLQTTNAFVGDVCRRAAASHAADIDAGARENAAANAAVGGGDARDDAMPTD
jgi:hypothetical protein